MQLATSARMLFVLLAGLSTHPGHTQSFHDLIVTEIMADPTPVIGLPEAEYLEIHNRTNSALSLKGNKLEYGSRSAFLPDSIIPPKGYLIVCRSVHTALFKGAGKVIGLSNFNLPNESATVTLRNPGGALLFSFSYAIQQWPSGRRDGGYALEMVNTDYPCIETGNWAASPDSSGGTPGRANAATGSVEDDSPPRFDRIEMLSPQLIQVVFSEKLDSISLLQANISITNNSITASKLLSPELRVLEIQLASPLFQETSYVLAVSGLADCVGNQMEAFTYRIGLPSDPANGDVIINEVLFNPPEGGVDFVEIYNKSTKFLSLRNWQLSNLRNGQPGVTRIITTTDYLLPPDSYLALTTDPETVKALYPAGKSGNYLAMPSLPSYPNTSGGISLQAGSLLMDQLSYSEKMHHQLLSLNRGVSLERIDPYGPTSNQNNWHSATSEAGYATPGLPNSQQVRLSTQVLFLPRPEVFSPNGDGEEDLTLIHYSLPEAGSLATLTIWDIAGRKIKAICNRCLLGAQGIFSWDGSRDDGQPVATGYYFLRVELYHIDSTFEIYTRKIDVVK